MANSQDESQLPESNDYLIGILVHRLWVTSSVARIGMSRSEIDNHVNHDFQTFDWNRMMSSLTNIHGSNEQDLGQNNVRDNTIELLGQIYRRCADPDRHVLLWGLADLFTCPTSEESRLNSRERCLLEPPSTARSLTQIEHEKRPSRTSGLHCYTSRLNERAQKEGKLFRRRKEEIVSHDPPLFRITVEYGNLTCSGRARTKKEAAHLAAKGICEKLNENLSL